MIRPSRPIRVALIGVSGYGGTHLKALEAMQKAGWLHLAAATVINQAEQAEKCARLQASGCRIYESYRDMLGKEAGHVDLCCIPTGIHWHCEMTAEALMAGCHVLVEKPAAATVQDVDLMIRTRVASQRQVAVGFQHLYQESYFALKRLIHEGEIGRLREIRVRISWPRPSSYYTRNEWAGRLRSKGRWVLDSPANNACAHFLMAALHLAGPEPLEAANPLSMEAELYRSQEIESFDTIGVRLLTDTNVQILFLATHSCGEIVDPLIELHGEEGIIAWELDNTITFRQSRRLEGKIILSAGGDHREAMFLRVFSQIQDGLPEACTLEEARKHTQLINALHRFVPIHDIPDSERCDCRTPSGVQSVIQGINESIRKAFEAGLLFSEIESPWASPAVPAYVRPMSSFSGPLSATPTPRHPLRMGSAVGD